MNSEVIPLQARPTTSQSRTLRLPVLIGSWLLVAGAMTGALMNYSSRPGTVNTTPARWPMDSSIATVPGHCTLLVFGHPKCPCTRASLFNLARAIAKPEVPVDTHLLFIRPREAGSDWCNSDIYTHAAEIKGVLIHTDDQGREAQRFGAETSGHAVLYDSLGMLVFSGGLTAERGHEGDNAGTTAITSALCGRVPSCAAAPVYGCCLRDAPTSESSPKVGESR